MISAELLIVILFVCFGVSVVIGLILFNTKLKDYKFDKAMNIVFPAPLIFMFCMIAVAILWTAVPCEVCLNESTPEIFPVDENAVQLQWHDGLLVGAQIYRNANDVVLIQDFSKVIIRGKIGDLTALIVHRTECAQTIFGIFDCYHYMKVWAELI